MYIEMTTFAIPTFLITMLKIALTIVGIWLVLAFIGIYFYNRSVAKQMEINAKIDSLHK
jgi:ABC-type sulfate transport system permease component